MIFHFLTLKCNASFLGFHSIRAFDHKVFIASFSFHFIFLRMRRSQQSVDSQKTHTHTFDYPMDAIHGCIMLSHSINKICTALSRAAAERAELPFGRMHFRNCKIATASQQDRAGGCIQIGLSIWFIIFKPFFRNWGKKNCWSITAGMRAYEIGRRKAKAKIIIEFLF